MDFLFVAQKADGVIVSEEHAVWNDVPDGLAQLSLKTSDGQVVVEIPAAPGRRLFFINEGVAVKWCAGILSAKLIGYEDDGVVYEWRLDLITDDGTPQLTHRYYPLANFEFDGGIFRRSM